MVVTIRTTAMMTVFPFLNQYGARNESDAVATVRGQTAEYIHLLLLVPLLWLLCWSLWALMSVSLPSLLLVLTKGQQQHPKLYSTEKCGVQHAAII